MAEYLDALIGPSRRAASDRRRRWRPPVPSLRRAAAVRPRNHGDLLACSFTARSGSAIQQTSHSGGLVARPRGAAAHRRACRAVPESRLFADAGMAVMTSGDVHIVVKAGPFGEGSGGHSHSDVLSLTVRLAGRDVLIDPGTFTYVADPVERDRVSRVCRPQHRPHRWTRPGDPRRTLPLARKAAQSPSASGPRPPGRTYSTPPAPTADSCTAAAFFLRSPACSWCSTPWKGPSGEHTAGAVLASRFARRHRRDSVSARRPRRWIPGDRSLYAPRSLPPGFASRCAARSRRTLRWCLISPGNPSTRSKSAEMARTVAIGRTPCSADEPLVDLTRRAFRGKP